MKSDLNHNQKLVFLALSFLGLLVYPIISIFNQPQLVGGIPVLYVFIFTVWLALIFIIGYLMRQKNTDKKSE